eukprot:1191747-Prorocentrum_minimum.AAC.1
MDRPIIRSKDWTADPFGVFPRCAILSPRKGRLRDDSGINLPARLVTGGGLGLGVRVRSGLQTCRRRGFGFGCADALGSPGLSQAG